MIKNKKSRKLHEVYLGLGSNLGDREQAIRQAVGMIDERVGKVLRRSSIIETEPWGFESGSRFLNGVVLCETALTPHQLLKTTQQIECDLGKRPCHATTRAENSCFKDRPIDIDILLYDDLSVDTPDLKIPHPLMYERDFVMKPLMEIRNH